MHTYIFKDRCGRVIHVETDDEGENSVAYHHAEPVGRLSISHDDCSGASSAVLLELFVEPSYRRSGIAHTLVAYACEAAGSPIRVRPQMASQSDAFSTLCRCLECEGLLLLH
ncbi:N-acetyltransferase [Paraburkholderia sp. UYCP14C]|uniref:GNAT family N-acetyltransferase n=1 Tax=Paraburkholderia sp. UYCP14C TaxID=2511130 RepID=UPI00102207AB|nr:GNAT family N-acetyltransferase [Paraburkholderia sp. UYCP14C]RZF26512.1 N-acetyltransferase [Paraburkholderia sp. UYCP14C]